MIFFKPPVHRILIYIAAMGVPLKLGGRDAGSSQLGLEPSS